MPPASGPIKVKVRKPVRVKAPAGDVASSGGNYGMKKAAPTVKRELKAIHVRQSQVKDTKGAQDMGRAKTYLKAHPEVLHPPKPKKKGGLFGTAATAIGDVAAAASAPALASAALASDKLLGTHVLPIAAKAVHNAPADVGELVTTTPSSLMKLGDTAIHHPTKVPGMLVAPYKQLAAHPVKFFTTHPVSTALMLDPGIRVPGRVLGKVARVTGKQTLARAAETVPNTALKAVRTGSRDYVVRKAQAAKDAKGPRTMTVRQVQKRVDESFGAQQKHRERIEHAIARKAKPQIHALPKADRPAFVAEQRAAASGAAKATAQQAYVKEFGATAYHNADGALIKPKTATEGVLHNSQADAQAVADKLNAKPLSLKHGGFTKVEKVLPLARQDVPVKFVVSKAGDKFGVMPDFVAERLRKQAAVGTSQAPGARLLRQSRGMFTRTVLPYRPTWLTGQAVEGVVRNTIMGAGPTSFLRARKVVSAMERQAPGSGKALMDRAVPAGKIGKVMKEFAGERKTLADEFPGNPIADSLTRLGRTPGIKQVRSLHHAISSTVFTRVNGQFLEGFPQTAMLGKALKNSPLMEKSILGLSDKAIEDAAKGLQNTHAQVELARAVQRAYGKYSNFGPALRESIVHWTPFIPWTLNAARFLTTVLPADHPVLQALVASTDAATEEWRKAHRLSMRSSNRLPFFDMGGYPTDKGQSVLRIGHYTPWGGAVDPTGGLASMVLPQFTGTYGALMYGVDWKKQKLQHKDGSPYSSAEQWLYGLQQLGEAMIPVAQQTQDIVGAKDKLKAVKKDLRVISSTRVKPDKNAPQGAGPLSQQDIDQLTKDLGSGGLSQKDIDALTGG